jgi:transglutaminase-like putative cysteine protease
MVYRLSWVAGAAGIAFALARAERLLRASTSGLPWEAVLVGAALLGAAITWAGVTLRVRGWLIVAANAIAVALTVVRVAVPQTTWWLFPTADSLTALGDELTFARDVIRSGIAPVIPLAGIIAILAIVFWAMGALLSWGLLSGRPYVAVLTPLVVYLEFAVMDKRPGGWWTTAFMIVIGVALVAVALDRRRDGTGQLTTGYPRRTIARSLPGLGVITLMVTLGVAVITAEAVAGLVPRSGYLDWRSGGGLSGEFYGSVTYNPFVGIRQQLLSQTDVPVFVAGVEGDLAADAVYWRMVTLDGFNGVQWHITGSPDIDRPEEIDAFEAATVAFAGPTARITADVTVLALQQDWLPAPYAPTGLRSGNKAVQEGYRVKTDDASLRFDALTYRGMRYAVDSAIPLPDLDVLGRRTDGSPSPIFESAADAGAFTFSDQPADIIARRLADADRYLDLPDDLDPGIRSLAVVTTRNLGTDFERGIALEAFFLAPGNFRYSTTVLPGHGATDLAAWLLDGESPNYRTGYCEQFAASMAVMARLLGIPSRVVLGFSPGTLLEDGRVVVRDRNAHAWVELWMSTQGWVRFDPTPRGDTTGTSGAIPFDLSAYLDVPEAERPVFGSDTTSPVIFRDDEFEILNDPIEALPGDNGFSAPGIPVWMLPAGVVLVALFGLVPAAKAMRRLERRRRLADGDVAAAWAEVIDRLTDLGEPPGTGATPAEVAASVDPALEPLATVYAEAVYGPEHGLQPGRTAVAKRSLETTESHLAERYSWRRRLRSQYRLTSLLPGWWRRRRAF